MKQRDPLEPRLEQAGYDARKTESEEKPVHWYSCCLGQHVQGAGGVSGFLCDSGRLS
jgi:hypothetical protein